VWNAHNRVFSSKRSAICALAVYFVHSTRPKIQGLVSRDSIVDRQFVTAWVREWVTNIRFMCRAVQSTVVRRCRKFLGDLLYWVYRPGEWLWIDYKVKMETRLPLEGSFGNKFPSSYNHCGVIIAAWIRKTLKMSNCLGFVEKRPLTGKFSEFCSERIYRDSNQRVVFKFCEIWPTGNR